MRFSIIVPVYNVEKYLEKCLTSILKQTYSDFEIIAVNDGSSDNSLEILNSFKKIYSCLKVVSQENKGLGGARNTGILYSSGEYLIFIDSDDYIEPDMLEDVNRKLSTYDLDMLIFDWKRIRENGQVIDFSSNKNFKKEFTLLTKKQLAIMPPSAVIRVCKKELFVNHKIFFPEKLWYEDFATSYKLVPFTNKAAYYKKPFYNYLQRDGSIMHTPSITRMMEIMQAFRTEYEFYKDNDFLNEYYEELEWLAVRHVLYFSAYSLFGTGYYPKEMKLLENFVKKYFPNYKNNFYVKNNIDKMDGLSFVIQSKYRQFYIQRFLKSKLKFKLLKIIKLIHLK